jgi:hypothetical protein
MRNLRYIIFCLFTLWSSLSAFGAEPPILRNDGSYRQYRGESFCGWYVSQSSDARALIVSHFGGCSAPEAFYSWNGSAFVDGIYKIEVFNQNTLIFFINGQQDSIFRHYWQ